MGKCLTLHWHVGRARRKRWQGEYHEAKGFRFYLVDDDRIEQLISWHQMGDEQAFGAALRQVKEAGLIPEDQVRLCAIGDGAPWIWKWVEELFRALARSSTTTEEAIARARTYLEKRLHQVRL